MNKGRSTLFSKGTYLIMFAIAISYLYPWGYMLIRSVMRHEPGLSDGHGLFTLEYYKLVLGNAGFLTFTFNSFFVLLFVLFANIAFSITVGYAFARYRFPFKRTLLLWY